MQIFYLRTCFPLYLVCGSNLLQLGSTFCQNSQNEREKELTGKKLNVDRESFKDVIRIFRCCSVLYLTQLQEGRVAILQFLAKIATHLPYFHLLASLLLND